MKREKHTEKKKKSFNIQEVKRLFHETIKGRITMSVLALVIINNPQGIYYGGTIAAPVVKEIFSNILPYLGIEKQALPEKEKEEEQE